MDSISEDKKEIEDKNTKQLDTDNLSTLIDTVETFLKIESEKDDNKDPQQISEIASAFLDLGNAILSFAQINQNYSLYERAMEIYYIAKQWGLDYNSDSNNCGLYNWCFTIFRVAQNIENKEDETFQKCLKAFETVSNETNDLDFYLLKGELYFVLERQDEEVKECFIKSKKDILEILTFLDTNNEEKIINTNILHSLLDSDNNGGIFFKEALNKLTQEEIKDINSYKDIYIHSIYIISRLHVNHEYEEYIAHYREKDISQKLLFGESKLRLNAIDFSNDLSEGKTLLDYLFGKGKYPSDSNFNIKEYEAFASCFVFDYDSMNLFRLYGKEADKEGTGLSLVINNSFFNKIPKIPSESSKTDPNDISEDKNKLALFRCIYMDPDPNTQYSVVTVGQKDKYLFYRENLEDNYKNYNEIIDDIVKKIKNEMNYIKEKVKNLNPAIVGQLLINLRYLVKHVAFKDEQECRIIKIFNLRDENIKIDDKFNRMYFEYPLEISKHIEKIIFGPKAEGLELFKSMLKNQIKDKDIPCFKSENPLA